MKRPTWWQRTAPSRTDPRVLILLWATGLAIVAYFLANHGFSNAALHRRLLVGFSAGLVNALFWKWLLRRYLSYYIDRELGLRSVEIGIVAPHAFLFGLLLAGVGIALDILGGGGAWIVSGGWALAYLLIYPEMKALHEGIKAKLAEMENTPCEPTNSSGVN